MLLEVIKDLEQKRLELMHALRPARAKADAAKVLSALPEMARRYERRIGRGLSEDPAEAAKARELLRDLLSGVVKLSPTKKGLVGTGAIYKAVLMREGSAGSGGPLVALFAASFPVAPAGVLKHSDPIPLWQVTARKSGSSSMRFPRRAGSQRPRLCGCYRFNSQTPRIT